MTTHLPMGPATKLDRADSAVLYALFVVALCLLMLGSCLEPTVAEEHPAEGWSRQTKARSE